jgi:hypothetical protein
MKLSVSSIPVTAKTRKMKTPSSYQYRGIFIEDIRLVEYVGWTIEQARQGLTCYAWNRYRN